MLRLCMEVEAMTDETPLDVDLITMTPTKSGRRQVGRSPAYPAIDLGRAIARSRVIWDMEKQYPMSPETVMKHWNYTSLNGPAGLQLSALVKFGLMDDQGTKNDRRVKLSDLAVTILNHPDESERQRAIRIAALTPQAHRDMWEEYGLNLPSDTNLMWNLTRERGFTESGAKEFIKEYRATIAYASMDEGADDELTSDNVPENEALPASMIALAPQTLTSEVRVRRPEILFDSPPTAESSASSSEWAFYRTLPSGRRVTRPVASQYPRFPIPLPGSRGQVTVEGPFPMSEAEWAYFLTVLQAMKPGFVQEPSPIATAENDDASD